MIQTICDKCMNQISDVAYVLSVAAVDNPLLAIRDDKQYHWECLLPAVQQIVGRK